jgi:murein DD-endopeptidase MepM/ murein hydrolase activator NlpD
VQARFRLTGRCAALTVAALAVLSYPLALTPKPAGAADVVSQDPEAHQTAPLSPLEALAGQFQADSARLDAVRLELFGATQGLNKAEAQVTVARSHLCQDAVASFVDGSAPHSDNTLSQTGTDDGPIRDEYLQTVTGDERDAVRRLEQARSTLKAQQANLQTQERAAQAALDEAARAKAALESSALPAPAVAVSAPAPPSPPATGGGGLPLPEQYLKNGSVDDGVDYSAPGGTPEFAMGPGVIIREGISGFGPNAPVLQITGGPLSGRAVYYGHAGPDLVPVGAQVEEGQQITIVGYGIVGESTGPHLEVGFYPVGANGAGRPMLEYINSVVGHSTGS